MPFVYRVEYWLCVCVVSDCRLPVCLTPGPASLLLRGLRARTSPPPHARCTLPSVHLRSAESLTSYHTTSLGSQLIPLTSCVPSPPAMSSSLSTPIKRLAVIGAGQMGTGIAYVSALRARCTSVTLVDSSPQQLSKSNTFLESLLQKDLSKGKIKEEEAQHARGAWRTVGSVEELRSAHPGKAGGDEGLDMVIEAATEKLPVKQSIFASLAQAFPDSHTILATNTSSISLSKIAASAVLASEGEEIAKSRSASRVVGLHWMNPVPVLPLVEIIPALQTSPETLRRAREFAEVCGKTLVQSKDSPSFIANRLLMPYLNEAIICLDEGVASREDIDATMHLAMGHPMGPLRLADFIGLDTCASIMHTLHNETGDSKYRPAVLLGRMVDAGWVGKKGGKGFYE